jgi:preprotein translocase subunit SecF
VQFIKQNININFVGKIRYSITFSCILVLLSAISLIAKGGPKYGIDFAGGTLVQVKFLKGVLVGDIRQSLQQMGIEDSAVQPFGDQEANEYLINMQKSAEDLGGLSEQVEEQFLKNFGQDSFEIRRVEMVGPKVGRDLRRKGFLAVSFSLLGMLLYIWWRFELRFGIGAIIALAHDVTVTMGALSITNRAIDLPIIAAVLTVVGYSVNDTIIVCDRIRENLRKMRTETLPKIINTSINMTLSRTILTAGTTLLVVVALFIFGGGVIHDFAFTLLVGIFIGTYSSIFIASPILILWHEQFSKKKIRKK